MPRWLQLGLYRIAPAWFLHPGPSHAELDERMKEWRPSGLSDDELRAYIKGSSGIGHRD